jgi:hypothetical protein
MMKKELLALLESASVKDLKELLALKKELNALEQKEKELVKQFSSVSRDIGSIQSAFGKPSGRSPGFSAKKKTGKATGRRAKRKGAAQPSLPLLIAEVLREKNKSLGVNDICDALLQEKKYKTKAKNFKSNVRILLYKNEKGLYKKVGPGRFRLAAAKKK